MATLVKSPGLTSTSPLSFLNSSRAIKDSDLRPALTTDVVHVHATTSGGDHFARAHFLAREAFLEKGGETILGGYCGAAFDIDT